MSFMISKSDDPLLSKQANDGLRPNKGNQHRFCGYIVATIFAFIVTVGIILMVVFVVDWNNNDSNNIIMDSEYWENEIIKIPTNDSCYQYSLNLADEPHVTGDLSNFKLGDKISNIFDDLGIHVMRQNISNVVLSKFVSNELNVILNDDSVMNIDISNEAFEADSDTNDTFRHRAWFSFGATANKTFPLLYVNDVSIDDLEYIQDTLGFNLSNYIGIGKYGSRNQQAINAGKYGLQGLILFRNPPQYGRADQYPNGKYLPDAGFLYATVRQSVGCPGNPSKQRLMDQCGFNETDGVSWEELFPSIYYDLPMISISAKTGNEIFGIISSQANNNCDIIPNDTNWETNLPNTVCMGGNIHVNLVTNNTFDTDARIENIYGYIEGTLYPDEIIMIGAHRDAWAFGAMDDISGTTTMIEVAKSLSELMKQNWKPKRSIMFASWDGEEIGLYGSVYFNEESNDYIDKIISYINLDMTVSGGTDLALACHPIQNDVLLEAAKKIMYPYRNDGTTFYTHYTQERGIPQIPYPTEPNSDHAAFYYYSNIPSVTPFFGGSADSYHTFYDTNKWLFTVDPQWKYAESMAQYIALVTLKLSQENLIPFNLTTFSQEMFGWVNNELFPFGLQNNCSQPEWSNYITQLDIAVQNFSSSISIYETSLSQFISDNPTIISNDENNINEYQVNITKEYNNAIYSLNNQLRLSYPNGIPSNIWYKNLIMGVGNSRFPYIYDTIMNGCNNNELSNAFNITINALLSTTHLLRKF